MTEVTSQYIPQRAKQSAEDAAGDSLQLCLTDLAPIILDYLTSQLAQG